MQPKAVTSPLQIKIGGFKMRIRERAEEYGTHTLINKELIALLTGAELDINNINYYH